MKRVVATKKPKAVKQPARKTKAKSAPPQKPKIVDVPLDSIKWDYTIQCRDKIDFGVVNEYAAAMKAGAAFPPVVLFRREEQGKDQRYHWLADGWHRFKAAYRTGSIETIKAEVHICDNPRDAALRYALRANDTHGLRRTNADKRKAVLVALKEFPKLSSKAISDLCGVSRTIADDLRKSSKDAFNASSKRTGKDGKQYPPTRKTVDQPIAESDVDELSDEGEKESPLEEAVQAHWQKRHAKMQKEEIQGKKSKERVRLPKGFRKSPFPDKGMYYAELAVEQLEQIDPSDTKRNEAFSYVWDWLREQGDAKLIAKLAFKDNAMDCAEQARSVLYGISENDKDRNKAFDYVQKWINESR